MNNETKQSGPSAPLKKLLTEQEMGEILGVSRRNLSNLRNARSIRFIKLGRLVRFDPDLVAADLARLTVNPRVMT